MKWSNFIQCCSNRKVAKEFHNAAIQRGHKRPSHADTLKWPASHHFIKSLSAVSMALLQWVKVSRDKSRKQIHTFRGSAWPPLLIRVSRSAEVSRTEQWRRPVFHFHWHFRHTATESRDTGNYSLGATSQKEEPTDICLVWQNNDCD